MEFDIGQQFLYSFVAFVSLMFKSLFSQKAANTKETKFTKGRTRRMEQFVTKSFLNGV